MDKILRDVMKQSVSIFDGFAKRLGVELVKSFRIALEKAYSKNLVECPVSLPHVSRAVTTSASWQSDGDGEAHCGTSSSKRRTGDKTPRRRISAKSRGCG